MKIIKGYASVNMYPRKDQNIVCSEISDTLEEAEKIHKNMCWVDPSKMEIAEVEIHVKSIKEKVIPNNPQ